MISTLKRSSRPRKKSTAALAAHLLPLEGQVGLGHGAHLVLDPREILRRERCAAGKVVVEAVLDGRTDRQLDLGEQALHRLGHHVRGGVTQRGERRRVAVELAGQLEMSLFFRLGHTLLRTGGLVGSGGFEPPTSSASERRSPTELRACPEWRSCYTPVDSSVKPTARSFSSFVSQCSRLVSDDLTMR